MMRIFFFLFYSSLTMTKTMIMMMIKSLLLSDIELLVLVVDERIFAYSKYFVSKKLIDKLKN